jgi:hypothetical protein
MKVRFYCDIPNQGIRLGAPLGAPYGWCLIASSTPSSAITGGLTRVAFDVDMPPTLVLPPHDVMAPADAAKIVEVGE